MSNQELEDLTYLMTAQQLWDLINEDDELTEQQREYLHKRWLDEQETETLIQMGR